MILSHTHFDLLDKVILEKVVFQPPLKADASLREEACFLHVIQGQSRLHAPVEQLNLASSDSLLMKCGSYVNRWFKREDQQPSEVIFIHFYPEVLKEVYGTSPPAFLSAQAPSSMTNFERIKVNELIGNYINSLEFYFQHPQLVNEELVKLKIKEIILLLAKTENATQISSILSDLANPNQYEFKSVIQANLFENVSVEDLAILTGYSLSSFKRQFKKIFGTSPNRYISQQRLEKAKELLETTGLKISAVAYDCGFSDLGYFSKLFRQAYDMTPTAFRAGLLSQLSQ